MAPVERGAAAAAAGKLREERTWRAGLTGATSVAAHGLALAASLVCVRLTVAYLGAERYGVWLTMSSVLSWLAVTDFGLGGNALVNALSEAHGREDRLLARKVVGTAWWTLVAISAFLLTAGLLLFPYVPWSSVFAASNAVSPSELHAALWLAFGAFVLMFPLSAVEAVYRGYQEGYIGNLWTMAGSVLTVVSVLLVTRARGGLPALVVALMGARTATGFASGLYALRRYPWLTPGPDSLDRKCFRRLSGLGAKYLATQVAGIGLFQSQPMIIAHLLGPAQVGIFHVTNRLMSLPSSLCWTATVPLISAYGEARERRDWPWIRSAFRISVLLTFAAGTIVLAGFAVFANQIVRFWVGPGMEPGKPLASALAAYGLLLLVSVPVGVVLYGLERVGGVALCAAVNSVLTVAASLFLATRFGLVGIAVAMGGSLLVSNLVGQGVQAYRALQGLEKQG